MKITQREALIEILRIVAKKRCDDCGRTLCAKEAGCECECHRLLAALDESREQKDRQLQEIRVENEALRAVLDCEKHHAEQIIEEHRSRTTAEKVYGKCLRCHNDELKAKIDGLLRSDSTER